MPGERYARKIGEEQSKLYKRRALADLPLKVLGEAQDVGELVVYLVSDEALAINGQAIVIDGGGTI